MDIAALFDDARRALAEGGHDRERLGVWVTPRRVLGIARAPRLRVAGVAWRLGVLLLSEDAVYGIGEVVRAGDPGRRGYSAHSARERAEVRIAALRAGVPAGENLHIGWTEIDLELVRGGSASGPLAPLDEGVGVRWSASGSLRALEPYLREQLDLRRGSASLSDGMS